MEIQEVKFIFEYLIYFFLFLNFYVAFQIELF